jgi:hypothetical protein
VRTKRLSRLKRTKVEQRIWGLEHEIKSRKAVRKPWDMG